MVGGVQGGREAGKREKAGEREMGTTEVALKIHGGRQESREMRRETGALRDEAATRRRNPNHTPYTKNADGREDEETLA